MPTPLPSRLVAFAAAGAALSMFGLTGCDERQPGPVAGAGVSVTTAAAPLDVRPPEVAIEAPANGATVSGVVAIEVRARKRDLQLDRTELFIGGELVLSTTQDRFTHSWSTSGLSGSWTISATTRDVEGNTASASITVNVAGGGAPPPPPSPTLQYIAVTPDTVTAGTPATGRVALAGPAPAGGTAVSLVSSRAGVASVPPSVTVAAGDTVASFAVTSHPVAQPDWTAITGTTGTGEGDYRTVVLWVMPAGVTMDSLTLAPTVVASGETSVGTVRLTGPAPAGGAAVALHSNNTQRATVPPSVTVAAGATTATFEVTAQTVSSPASVSIEATYGGVMRFAWLTVTPPAPGGGQLASLSIEPNLVVGGETAQGTVTLGAATGSDTHVALSSSTPSVATVPASVTVPSGALSASFPVTTQPNQTGQGQFAEIRGEAGGVVRTATITTTSPPTGPAISAVALFPATLGGGGAATGIVRFAAPLTDGVLISITSSHPDLVQVPEGTRAHVIWSSSERAFPITTAAVPANTTVTITATACCGGLGEATATLTVTTAAPPPPDVVRVTQARWRPGGRGGTLEVRATSTSETAILSVFRGSNPSPDFTLRHTGGGRYQGEASFGGGATNPGTITVRSNLGGSVTADVR